MNTNSLHDWLADEVARLRQLVAALQAENALLRGMHLVARHQHLEPDETPALLRKQAG
jgi:hypothetical protein